jgi:hypothetical protein
MPCKNPRLDCGSPLPLFLFTDKVIPKEKSVPATDVRDDEQRAEAQAWRLNYVSF